MEIEGLREVKRRGLIWILVHAESFERETPFFFQKTTMVVNLFEKLYNYLLEGRKLITIGIVAPNEAKPI